MHCAEYRDLVAAHVDELLTPEEAPLVAAHLASCLNCARLLEDSTRFRDALRESAWLRETPAHVRAAVVEALDGDDRASRRAQRAWQWWPRPVYRTALAAALAVMVLALGVRLLRWRGTPPTSDVFAAIVADFHAVEADKITLRVHTDEPAALQRYYQEAGLSFSNTVMDMQPSGWRLVGGTVTQLSGHKSTLTVYQGTFGMLLCHRIRAADFSLPAGGETIDGDTFYTIEGVTVCVHRDGDVYCFMASALPRDEFMKRLVRHV